MFTMVFSRRAVFVSILQHFRYSERKAKPHTVVDPPVIQIAIDQLSGIQCGNTRRPKQARAAHFSSTMLRWPFTPSWNRRQQFQSAGSFLFIAPPRQPIWFQNHRFSKPPSFYPRPHRTIGRANTRQTRGAMPVNDTDGGDLISAWPVEPGVCWIQTSSAQHARRLSQRSDSKIVGVGVAGGYLRTFEVCRPLAWAKRFIRSHEKNEEPTNGAVLVQESPTSRREKKLARTGGLVIRTQQTGDGNNN